MLVECLSGYIAELMELLFTKVFPDNRRYLQAVLEMNIPDPLSSQYEHPPKDEVVAALVSRFRRVEQGPHGQQ